ncbi:MAG: RNA polymerase sigma factor [Bacteroidota bacterium]
MFDKDFDTRADEKLIAEALEGNKASLNLLLKRHQDYIYNISLRLFLNPDDALDATQEVLIKVVTRLKTFKGKSQFRTWLYRITTNHFLNAPQRKFEKMFSNRIDSEEFPDTVETDNPYDQETIEEVRMACSTGMLMCLNREQRLIYIIGDVFGADHRLGAELFNISPANFRVKLYRAKSDLLNYVSKKCGLVDANNPCRCNKKAKIMVEKGYVDPNKFRFNIDFKQKVDQIVSSDIHKVSDHIQLNMSELFQDSPFQVKQELDALLGDLVK